MILWNYVKREIARLKVLRRGLAAKAERDRRRAEQAALFDAGPAAALRLRYESSNERTLMKALSDLAQHRKTGLLTGGASASGGDGAAGDKRYDATGFKGNSYVRSSGAARGGGGGAKRTQAGVGRAVRGGGPAGPGAETTARSRRTSLMG